MNLEGKKLPMSQFELTSKVTSLEEKVDELQSVVVKTVKAVTGGFIFLLVAISFIVLAY